MEGMEGSVVSIMGEAKRVKLSIERRLSLALVELGYLYIALV